jgi:CheY-like chemotaxis protein
MSGRLGLEKLIKNREKSCCEGYSIVIMDCNMPVMDGFQVICNFISKVKATRKLKTLMKEGELKPIPIIGHSAFTAKSQIDKCLQAGMDDYCKHIFYI